MGIFSRYGIYLLDSILMAFVLGLQIYLFRGEFPLRYDFHDYLSVLLEGHNIKVWTLILATGYWTIMDYHPALTRLRGWVVDASGQRPAFSTRVLRSGIKSLTLFTLPCLLLFALFSKGHTLLHDYVAKTDRIQVVEA